MSTPDVSRLLPVNARIALQNAAATKDEAERRREIDHVTQQLRLFYPQFFKHDKEQTNESNP